MATNLIDCDHGELAMRVEAVRAAVTHCDSERLDRALRQLRDFALTHYGLEESIMIASRYPHTREHIRMHQRLIGVLDGVMHRRQREGAVLRPEAVQAIEELHTLHLRTEDARLGQWLNRKPM